MSENLYFYKGYESDLPRTGIKVGALYHCIDTGNTYRGISDVAMELFSNTINSVSGSIVPFKSNFSNNIEVISNIEKETSSITLTCCGRNVLNLTADDFEAGSYYRNDGTKHESDKYYRSKNKIPIEHLRNQIIAIKDAPANANAPGMCFYGSDGVTRVDFTTIKNPALLAAPLGSNIGTGYYYIVPSTASFLGMTVMKDNILLSNPPVILIKNGLSEDYVKSGAKHIDDTPVASDFEEAAGIRPITYTVNFGNIVEAGATYNWTTGLLTLQDETKKQFTPQVITVPEDKINYIYSDCGTVTVKQDFRELSISSNAIIPGSGMVTGDSGVAIGDQTLAAGDGTFAQGDPIFRTGASILTDANNKYYISDENCVMAQLLQHDTSRYTVISKDKLEALLKTNVTLLPDGTYVYENDMRYTEAYGTGSASMGQGSVAYSRSSKSMGYRTQTGAPSTQELRQLRPEVVMPEFDFFKPTYKSLSEIDLNSETHKITGGGGVGENNIIEYTLGAGGTLVLSIISAATSDGVDISYQFIGNFLSDTAEGPITYLGLYGNGTVNNAEIEETIYIPIDTYAKRLRLIMTTPNTVDITVDVENTKYYPAENVGQNAVAFGADTAALANQSMAIGYATQALKASSFASGRYTVAGGNTSFSGGNYTQALGKYSKAMGSGSIAKGKIAMANGENVMAIGENSHAEGKGSASYEFYDKDISVSNIKSILESTTSVEELKEKLTDEWNSLKSENKFNLAYGTGSHTEGINTFAYGKAAHAENFNNIAIGTYAHAEGSGVSAEGHRSHAEGRETMTIGENAHAEGYGSIASGDDSHAEGNNTQAAGNRAHSEGLDTIAEGNSSHAEGQGTIASGECSHAEGYYTIASGAYQHVQGKYNIEDSDKKYVHIVGWGTSDDDRQNIHTIDTSGNAYFTGVITTDKGINGYITAGRLANSSSGIKSTAEGLDTTASGDYSHAEGYKTTASKIYAHAEGNATEATGEESHAEGYKTTASGMRSHSEGAITVAEGANSHAEGQNTKTTSNAGASHVEGYYTIAASKHQHVQGKYNVADTTGQYVHIVGWGSSDTNRKNIHTIDTKGNGYFSGDIYVGGTSSTTGRRLPRIYSGTKEPSKNIGEIGDIYIVYKEGES